MAKSTLLEEIRVAEQQQTVSRCKLSEIIPKLSKEDLEALRDAMNTRVSTAVIAKVLQGRGFAIRDTTIRRCRQSCDCWRSE